MPGAQVPDTDILADLRRVADTLGDEPTQTEYLLYGEYTPATAAAHFGSWSAAKEVAGV